MNPEWHEKFTFHVNDPSSDILSIKVYDHDMIGKNDKMGNAQLPLCMMPHHHTIDVRVKLRDVNRGYIVLKMRAADFGWSLPVGQVSVATSAPTQGYQHMAQQPQQQFQRYAVHQPQPQPQPQPVYTTANYAQPQYQPQQQFQRYAVHQPQQQPQPMQYAQQPPQYQQAPYPTQQPQYQQAPYPNAYA